MEQTTVDEIARHFQPSFAKISNHLAEIDIRLARGETRLDQVEKHLCAMDGRLDVMDGRLDTMSKQLNGHLEILVSMDGMLKSLIKQGDKTSVRIDDLETRVGNLEAERLG